MLFVLGFVSAIGLCPRALVALEAEQFVAGWPLELPSDDDAFYDIPLTYEVYRYGRALDQLAVLDRRGEPMPFYLVEIAAADVSEQRITRGVSALYAPQDGEAVAELSVATEGDRTSVSVTRPPAGTESEIVAFVVDAREVGPVPIAIELQWRALDRPFLMNVSIEHSEALTDWQSVGRGSAAALSIDGAEVRHDRIAVDGKQGGYYRINWDRRIADWQLERVVLIHSEQAEAARSLEVDLSAAAPPEQAIDNALYFDAGGRLPATSATLVFPAGDRWANASLAWRNATDERWRQVARRRLFYDLRYEGQRFASAPVELGRVQARYWRVVFDGAAPAGSAELRLAYPDERLRFAANGEPPYMLVGETLSGEAGPDATFAAVVRQLGPDPDRIPAARLSARVELGGAEALQRPFELPWRSVLLWAALFAGVASVAWMALKLTREMLAES